MANNPFDPPIVQVKKTLNRGGLGTVNRGYGSLKSGTQKTRQAPPAEQPEWWPENLSELSDVDVVTTPPEPWSLLGWNGTSWVPVPESEPAPNQLLSWNAALQKWEPRTVSGGGGGGAPSYWNNPIDDPEWGRVGPSAYDMGDGNGWSGLSPIDSDTATTAVTDDDFFQVTYTSNENRMRGRYRALPSGAFDLRAKIYAQDFDTAGRQGIFLGIGVSPSGAQRGVGIWNNDELRAIAYSSPSSTASGSEQLSSAGYTGMSYVYARVQYDGSGTCVYSFSKNGLSWHTTQTESFTPTVFGPYWENNRNREFLLHWAWMRFY